MKSINRIFAIATLAILFCASIVAQGVNPYESSKPRQDSQSFMYLIGTSEEMSWFVWEVNNGDNTISANLINSINYEGEPIGTRPNYPFSGTFDGCYYRLTANVDCSGSNYGGLFLYAANATIRNLFLSGTVTGDGQYMSALVGCLVRGKLDLYSVIVENAVEDYCNRDIVKYVAGFVGHTRATGKLVSHDLAFSGSVKEVYSTNQELKICGFIGKDDSNSGTGHIVSNSYFSPASLGSKSGNSVIYPFGDVRVDIDEFFGDETVNGTANRLLYVAVDGYTYQSPVYPALSNAFRSVTATQLQASNMATYLGSAWTTGTKFPTLNIPVATWIGGASGKETAWSDENNWDNSQRPGYSVDAIVPSTSYGPVVTSDMKARTIVVESGASLSFSDGSHSLTRDLNVQEGAKVYMSGKSLLFAMDVNVDADGLFEMHYDHLSHSPSLVYLNNFNGKARILRGFAPNRITYVGSATEECTYSSITAGAWAYVYNYLGAEGWSDLHTIYNDGLDDDNTLFDNAPVETGRAMSLACKYPGSTRVLEMVQEGTPVCSYKKFVVSTESANKNLVVVSNPYPFTVDISNTSNITSAAWTIYVKEDKYKVAKYNSNGDGLTVNTDTQGPNVAPFKTVTYTVPDGVSTITLSNTQPATANNRIFELSKSAKINDTYFKVRLYSDGNLEADDEVGFMFGEGGSMSPDVKLLDSGSSLIEDVDPISKDVSYPSNQLFINKPLTSQDLAIAYLPVQSEVVNYELPIRISLCDNGVTSLKISGADMNTFNELYDVYLYDRLKNVFVNLRYDEYEVPNVDLITDDRFSIVLTELNELPDVKEYVPTATGDITSDQSSNLVITSKDGKVIVNNVPDELIGSNIDVYNTLGVKVSSTQAEVNNTLDANGSGVRAVVVNNSQAKKILVK